MSKRRNVGDIVRTIPLAGFSFLSHRIRLVDLDPEYGDPWEVQCYYDDCEDPHCREWCNAEILDEDGAPTGSGLCHVSECRMVDEKEHPARGEMPEPSDRGLY